jgi:hypothetical protein
MLGISYTNPNKDKRTCDNNDLLKMFDDQFTKLGKIILITYIIKHKNFNKKEGYLKIPYEINMKIKNFKNLSTFEPIPNKDHNYKYPIDDTHFCTLTTSVPTFKFNFDEFTRNIDISNHEKKYYTLDQDSYYRYLLNYSYIVTNTSHNEKERMWCDDEEEDRGVNRIIRMLNFNSKQDGGNMSENKMYKKYIKYLEKNKKLKQILNISI